MATSGSFNTSGYNGRYLRFAWSVKSQNVANNTTTISWTLKGAGTISGDDASWYLAGNIKLVIDGETVYTRGKNDRFELWNGTSVASGEKTITHNADGTRNFTASAQAGIYTFAVNCTGSKTFTLDDIARASQPSLVTWPETTNDVGDFGDTISIHTNRASDAFTHTVRYAFGNLTGTIATGVTTGTTWKIPLSFMDLLPESTSGSGLIYVDTYNGSTLIGTKYTGFTATVPASVKPTCTFTLDDTTGADDIYGSPVKGLSKIKVTVTATKAYSSPIESITVDANGVKYSGSPITTAALTKSGTSRVTVTVKDKRGRTGTNYYDMTVLDYGAPAVTDLAVHRCDADGTNNDRGEYIKATFTAAVSSMSGKNTASYKLRYKKTSASAYTTVTLSAIANNFAPTYSYVFAADGSSAYDVAVDATDRHSTGTRSTSASTAFTLINFHASGTALRFGGVAQKENTFTNSLSLEQEGNTYAFQPGAFNGEKGYTCLAQVTLNTLNVNAPIVFKLNRRGAVCPMNVYIRFASSSTSTDPDLASIVYEGDNYGAFMVKTATSTWKLYVDNTSGWSNPCLQEWFTTDNQAARLSVSFPNEQVATLPTPYYRATPVISQSVLDAFYPVGYILLLYSHADPNSMYPGTTWVRITNAFLWATTSGGTIGQTGGEAEHTLTVNEIPSHSHGRVYSDTVSEKKFPWFNSAVGSGDKVGYDYVMTGGGEAHNNMPPYIQVSIWRRTA